MSYFYTTARLVLFSISLVQLNGHFQERRPQLIEGHASRILSTRSNGIRSKVIIIGAGLSGLETARILRQNGIETIVLEGRNRIGGRIWSVRSKNGYMFDLGAAWIHGINGSIPSGLQTNPLWDLTQEAKIRTRGTLQTDMLGIYPSNYSNFDVSSLYHDYVVFVRNQIKTPMINASLQYYADIFVIQRNLSQQHKDAFYSFLHFAIESYEGTELDTIDAKGFLDVTSLHYGEEHVFQETGYVALIDYLAKRAGDVRLDKIVTKISYGESFIQVETTDNELYQAEFVVITVPLGVLKARNIQFNPPLPQWKLNAIDRLGFGILDKAVLIWEKAWWNSTNYYFMRVSEKPTEFGYWVNVNKWDDKPALMCYFVGKEAYRIETTLTKNEVVDELMRTLKNMFPNTTIPTPIDSYLTYWKQDPFSNGSYSYVSVGQRFEDPSYLAEPINDQLLFAGEATSTDSYGYAHGALMSARREATRLLFVYDLLPKHNSTTSQGRRTHPFCLLCILSFMIASLIQY